MTAAAEPVDPLAAARNLRETLVELADRLAGGRLDAVLDLEPKLATVVAAFTALARDAGNASLADPQKRALTMELEKARAALKRCALLGASLDDLVRARCGSGYRATGSGVAVTVTPTIEGQA